MGRKSSTRRHGLRWWDWALIVIGLPTLVFLLWLLRRRTESSSAVRIEIKTPAGPVEVPVVIVEPAPSAPDDLKRIKGIGPKTSSLLQEAGIVTFTQLAATDVSQLEKLLREAGLAFIDPATWPEQASLAAVDKGDALEALRTEFKKGRRV